MDISTQITNIITSSTEPEELKNKIVKEIAIELDADQCFFIEYDSATHNFKKITNLYSQKREALSLLDYDFENNLKYISVKLKYMKSFVIKDVNLFIKNNRLENTKECEYFKDFKAKAFLAVRLEFGETFLGILAVNYSKRKNNLKETDLKFLINIAEHISIALHLSKLYIEEKNKSEREKLLSSIVSIMGESYDLGKINQKIFTILGKVYNAQSIFINIDAENLKRSYSYNFSKSKSDEFKDYEKKALVNLYNLHNFDFVKSRIHYIPNVHHFIISNNLENSSIEKYFKKNDIKSIILLPLLHEYVSYGLLIIHFDILNPVNREDFELIKTITTQFGIVIKQIQLYKKEKYTASKEIILRNIITKIRSSFDIEEIKHEIANQIGMFLNADGVRIAYYDYKLEDYVITKGAEYRSSDNLRSWVGVKFKNIPGFVEYIRNVHLQGEDIIFSDLEEHLDKYNLRGTGVEKLYRSLGFVSSAAINIYYGDKYVGDFVVTFENPRDFSDDEIKFLKVLADQAGVAINQAELFEKEKKTAERESLLRKITETIRSSLDINEIKNTLVAEICKALNADRCFIIEYNQDNKKFLPVENEYLVSPDLKSSIGFDLNKEAQEFSEKDKMGEDIIITDIDKYLFKNNLYNTATEKHLREYSVQSAFSVPIFYADQILGILVIHYTVRKGAFRDEEVQLVRTLASQIGITLNQAELYEKEKRTKEMEITLRETIKVIRSTFDVKKIKKSFVNITNNYFKPDRCMFIDYNRETAKFLPIEIEILREEGIKSLIGVDIQEVVPEFVAKLKNKKRNIIIKDTEKILLRKKLLNYKAIETVQKNEAKSDYGFIVQYKDEIIGILILHYVKNKRVFTHEELDFLKVLRDQVGIALYQAKLFAKEKQTAERETLLRIIAEKIRSSLDLDETLSFICEETAKIFNVQRTAIAQFPNPENFEEIVIKKEYKSSSETRGIAQAENFPKAAAYWGDILMKSNEVMAFDNIETSDTPDHFKTTYNLMGIKSMMGTSIRKGKDVWGTLVLSEYNEYRHWTDEEKILLKAIANQVYIAINQAELYETAQTKAQNEKTLREIMLSSVSSFDMKEIIKSIVTEAGKLFKADRCFFAEIDYDTMTNFPIRDYAEYLSSEDIVSHTTRQPSKAETGGFIDQIIQHYAGYMNNVSNADLPEATKKMLIDYLSVKSHLMVPVFFGDITYGAIVFHYVHEFKQFSQDEIDMAMAIANQSAIVIHQAELYKITKIQAEREKISKNIIEILRSTLDKIIIKKLFVKNIGKFLDADRVIFSEYDSNERKYLPVDKDSEYLSDSNLNSFVGYDWSCEEAQEYIQPLLEKREFHIYNWEEYLQSNTRSQNFIHLFERRGVKSSYSFPVIYQQQIMGFFSIAFTKEVRRLNDEDINRIRNICTQAGIALYHANLYEKAQKSIHAHAEFVNKLSNELKDPLYMIVEFSEIETAHELECHEEIEHLNNVNNNAKKLLYLLDDIIKNSKTEIDFN